MKTIFDKKTGELLGAHMIGAEVTELIQGLQVIAMNCEINRRRANELDFLAPDAREMMRESVLDAYGRAMHV